MPTDNQVSESIACRKMSAMQKSDHHAEVARNCPRDQPAPQNGRVTISGLYKKWKIWPFPFGLVLGALLRQRAVWVEGRMMLGLMIGGVEDWYGNPRPLTP